MTCPMTARLRRSFQSDVSIAYPALNQTSGMEVRGQTNITKGCPPQGARGV
eukprot:CAMPEP_0179934052 /NCGR_PEP_ID=MMETSP0983-20121128/12228_1 /TAXON_ID=483367 /ORGANISM="non described non described, Strain CCMP 2436" /LENGTH=50 /DNA_ID=CAMNT_0021838963 /DNA_START=48 /DNA_END=200 /DNA_ORIENTATION=+